MHRLTFLVLYSFIFGYLLLQEIWHKFSEGIGLHLYGKLFFIAFGFFEVVTHFVAEKGFLICILLLF